MEEYNYKSEAERYFINKLLTPYLSSVYFGLIQRQSKGYISIERMNQYLNLPQLLGERMVNQINANGDERIDHDEFV